MGGSSLRRLSLVQRRLVILGLRWLALAILFSHGWALCSHVGPKLRNRPPVGSDGAGLG